MRKADAKPGRPLEAYQGKYEDPAYGTCVVALERGQLIWSWENWRCPLEHLEQDTFLADSPNLVNAAAEFRVGPRGRVVELKILGRVFRRTGSD